MNSFRTYTGEPPVGGLIVSVQPVRGGRFDSVDFVRTFVGVAQDVGAGAVRLEGSRDIESVHDMTPLPIVGLIKHAASAGEAFITTTVADVRRVAAAGARIVAVDATARRRPEPLEDLLHAIHDEGLDAMADVADEDEGRRAWAQGFDYVATTLSGYTGPPVGGDVGPDLTLVRNLAKEGIVVVAEGRVRSPSEAAAAIAAGARAVTVGTALTRPELVAAGFVSAIRKASPGPGRG